MCVANLQIYQQQHNNNTITLEQRVLLTMHSWFSFEFIRHQPSSKSRVCMESASLFHILQSPIYIYTQYFLDFFVPAIAFVASIIAFFRYCMCSLYVCCALVYSTPWFVVCFGFRVLEILAFSHNTVCTVAFSPSWSFSPLCYNLVNDRSHFDRRDGNLTIYSIEFAGAKSNKSTKCKSIEPSTISN